MSGMRLFRETDALIVVDVQPTFMPGGGLAVLGGDEVVPIVSELGPRFDRERRFITLDEHDRGHLSLVSSYIGLAPMTVLTTEMVEAWDISAPSIAPHALFSLEELKAYLAVVGSQVLWPEHAIAGTEEAALHPDLDYSWYAFAQRKGRDPKCDSYSGFYDNLRRPTGFADVVAASGAKRLFICGLAFDFCVGWTALDARKALPDLGVFVIEDACRSVDMPDSVENMRASLKDAGVELIKNDFWL